MCSGRTRARRNGGGDKAAAAGQSGGHIYARARKRCSLRVPGTGARDKAALSCQCHGRRKRRGCTDRRPCRERGTTRGTLRGRPRSASIETFYNVDCRCERIYVCSDARIHIGPCGRSALSSASFVSVRARTSCYQLVSTDASCRHSPRYRGYMQAGWLRDACLSVSVCACAANVWTYRGADLGTFLYAASTGEGP